MGRVMDTDLGSSSFLRSEKQDNDQIISLLHIGTH